MVPGRDEQKRGGVRADPVEGEKAGSVRGHEGDDELIKALELGVKELRAPSQLAQRDASGVADGAARTGTQRRQPGDQGGNGVPGEAGSQVIWAGHDQRPGLVDRLGTFCCGAAPGDHQRTDRLDGAVASFGRAAGPARLSGPGSADGVQWVGLALPAAVLAVGAVNLDHADTGRGDMAGQAGAVAAGAFDPDQADGPEPAQPPQGGRRSQPGWPGTP